MLLNYIKINDLLFRMKMEEKKIISALDELFFCLRLASLDLKICPYHMTFLIKILKQLMHSTQQNIIMSFILKVESFWT